MSNIGKLSQILGHVAVGGACAVAVSAGKATASAWVTPIVGCLTLAGIGVSTYQKSQSRKLTEKPNALAKAVEAAAQAQRDQIEFMDAAQINAAEDALLNALPLCQFHPKELARYTVDEEKRGFPRAAADQVLKGLAEIDADTFGENGNESIKNYALAIIEATFEAALENPDYYDRFEKELTIQQAEAIGETLGIVKRIDETTLDTNEKVSALPSKIEAEGDKVLTAMEEMFAKFAADNIPESEWKTRYEESEKARLKLADELSVATNDATELDLLRQQAAKHIEAREMDKARECMRHVQEREYENSKQTALRLAKDLSFSGDLEKADGEWIKAANFYAKAAQTALPYDKVKAAEYWFAEAHAANEFGQYSLDPSHLERSEKQYLAALEIRSKESLPEEWAMTQNNLGAVLSDLGLRQNDEAKLEAAEAAYTMALEIRTKDSLPEKWAMTQNNLGAVLSDLGERQNDEAKLEEAEIAFTVALEIYTKESFPQDWAMTQNNLGTVLRNLGSRQNDEAKLEAAIIAYRAALEIYTEETFPYYWKHTQDNLTRAQKALDRLRSSGD